MRKEKTLRRLGRDHGGRPQAIIEQSKFAKKSVGPSVLTATSSPSERSRKASAFPETMTKNPSPPFPWVTIGCSGSETKVLFAENQQFVLSRSCSRPFCWAGKDAQIITSLNSQDSNSHTKISNGVIFSASRGTVLPSGIWVENRHRASCEGKSNFRLWILSERFNITRQVCPLSSL